MRQATGSGHVAGAPASKGALPGVRALLDVLADRDDVRLALLTGNFRQSAEDQTRLLRFVALFLVGRVG